MSKLRYADIAFPTAVRRLFTYETRDPSIRPGMRVWVPLRSEYAIGMVVEVHNRKPEFETRPVVRILDEEPVMDDAMLQLTEWIHRFYYCSWGEAVQAALPVGLNFSSEKRLRKADEIPAGLKQEESDLLNEIDTHEYTLTEAQKRWRDGTGKTILKKVLKKGWVEVWEEPKQKVGYRLQKHWRITESIRPGEVLQHLTEREKSHKWVAAFEELASRELPLPHSDLIEEELFTPYTLKRIEEEGWIESVDLPVTSGFFYGGEYDPDQKKVLRPKQQQAFEEIRTAIEKKTYASFLLYGVTGSGKTEVYIHALERALEQGRGGMVLVPEIALTPQTVERFYRIFGDQIAVLHSRLSDRERYEAWMDLRSGEKRIVIGPRSAVFAPVKELGLIVVDEEHDGSYKQFNPSPRYHARDVAIMRGVMVGAAVILGSATPSMASVKSVMEEKHTMLHLPGRPTGKLPPVTILNMLEYKHAMKGPLTAELHLEIEKALEREEQVILLYNRRGFSSYLQCEDCGHIPQSPESSTSLTYHKKKNILLCHYSGYSRRADSRCEKCRSENLVAKGTGTQRVEEEIQDLFPDARLLRMDRDTTSGKDGHRKIYEQFRERKADILIGTQLVAKGLDFPDVTIVGVLNADTELAFPSFRSGERMFQLLSQVAGRAGRSDKPGRVFIQTWKPDHPAILCAKDHNFREFARQELSLRKSLQFPPFSRLIVFEFRAADLKKTGLVAQRFCDAVRQVVGEGQVMGPSPSVIEWMHGEYHWEAHIKVDREIGARGIEHMLDLIFNHYDKVKPRGGSSVRINVDVDAIE